MMSVAPCLAMGSAHMMAFASACVAMQLSYIEPDGEFSCARGHAPCVQWRAPGGDPLYPWAISLLFAPSMTAKYCRFEHVEKIGASASHA